MKLIYQSRLSRIVLYFCIGLSYFALSIIPMCFAAAWFRPDQVNILQSVENREVDSHVKILLVLAAIGSVLAVGRLLAGDNEITSRLVLGRVILGAGLSVAAAAALAVWPNLPAEALIGIGAAFGILGQTFLESIVRRWLGGEDSV